MNFSTDNCPICKSKLVLDIKSEDSNKVLMTYYCAKNYFDIAYVKSMLEKTVQVYHYSHTIFKEGSISQIIVGPYMFKNCVPLNKTRIYFLPKEERPAELMLEIPIIDLDWSNESEVIRKTKTILVFS
jgi:hypothetical protein